MARPAALIVRAPGTNCDEETARAWEIAGARSEIWPIGRLLEAPEGLDAFQILTVPGGFSYGDDLGAGQIFAVKLAQVLGEILGRFRDRGGLILGVCNGFQVLVKAGLIPGEGAPAATLTYNNSGRYEARWTRMSALPGPGPWLTELEKLGRPIELPVAHGEGKFLANSPEDLDRLFEQGQIALQYVDDAGNPTDSFPANPNGSPRGIAAARDRTGRVFGLMPHPERFVEAIHHPQWTRRSGAGEPDGLLLFRGAIRGIG